MEQLLLDFESLPATAIPLMNPDELFGNCSQEILARAQETSLWERKSARVHREDLSTYFSMWANTPPHGGLVAVGIENDGKVTGCLSQDQQKINNLEKAGRELCSDARYDLKRINVVNDRGVEDYVIVIRVYYRPDKVVELSSGKGYIRRGDSRYTLSEEEKRELAIDKGQVSFEQEPCNLQFPSDFDMVAVGNFANSVKTKKSLKTHYTPEQVLTNRRLGAMDGRKFVPNIACALLFAKDLPPRFQAVRFGFKDLKVLRDSPEKTAM